MAIEKKFIDGDLYKKVADLLLDRLVELEGCIWTIQFLLDSGFSKHELETLCFDKDDIEFAEKELNLRRT